MVFRVGWFSTGRDEAARQLLQTVVNHISDGTIPAQVRYVFCNRERGESPESDRFIEFVERLEIPLIFLSSRDFLPGLRDTKREEWRSLYHFEVEERIRKIEVDLIVLAGYMLIVSPSFCHRFPIINLHPARPGGPKGTWQEVIWSLMKERAQETGVMIHLVTEDLDEGPPITYVTFRIKGSGWNRLWDDLERKLQTRSFQEWAETEGHDHPLFKEIRREGVRRELPLMTLTLKALAEGRVRIEKGRVFDGAGREIDGLCLNEEVERSLHRSWE